MQPYVQHGTSTERIHMEKGLRIDFLWSEVVQTTYERTTIRRVDNCGHHREVQEWMKGKGQRSVPDDGRSLLPWTVNMEIIGSMSNVISQE